MTHPDAKRWNERYAEEAQSWLARRPRQLLVDHAHLLPEDGLALDAAAGVASNGLFLAQRGLHVVALDVSEVALRLALNRARKRAVRLEAAVMDLAHPWLPAHVFDVIVNFHFLERATFSVYGRALKPGGILFFETFVKAEENAPHPDYYLDPNELRQAFSDFEILHWDQKRVLREDGRPPKVTSQLIARKPLTGECRQGK